MSSLLVRSLTYHLLPGNPGLDFPRADLHDQVYAFWKRFWVAQLEANGTRTKPHPDDFLRQDRVGVLVRGDEIVALHAHTFFDLRRLSAREHSYFSRYYTEKFFTELKERGAHRVMTIENFSLLPAWRSREVGVSLAAVMAGLGLEIAREADVDAAIAVARCDIGVDKIGKDQGAIALDTGLTFHNTPCELVAFFRDKMHPHADENVRKLVAHFWKNRVVTTAPEAAPLAIAA